MLGLAFVVHVPSLNFTYAPIISFVLMEVLWWCTEPKYRKLSLSKCIKLYIFNHLMCSLILQMCNWQQSSSLHSSYLYDLTCHLCCAATWPPVFLKHNEMIFSTLLVWSQLVFLSPYLVQPESLTSVNFVFPFTYTSSLSYPVTNINSSIMISPRTRRNHWSLLISQPSLVLTSSIFSEQNWQITPINTDTPHIAYHFWCIHFALLFTPWQY